MFKSKRNDAGATDTLIGANTVFEGKIKSAASIRIEGQLIGDIECGGDVTIGEGGKAKSNIIARSVVIAGTVHGNIVTKGTLMLTGTGQLYGNTSAHSLIISEGAVFQGISKMENKPTGRETEKIGEKPPSTTVAGSPYDQPKGGYGSTAV